MGFFGTSIRALALLGFGVSGCIRGPGFMKQDSLNNKRNMGSTVTTVASADFGVETAVLSANATVTQEVKVSNNSTLAGTVISFPPGALAVDTTIAIEEAVPVATASVAVSNHTIVIGAPQEDSSQTTITNGSGASLDNAVSDSGAAYVIK